MNQLKFIRRAVFEITQTEMAVIAGVQQGTVSRWESGLRAPTQRQLQRIRDEAIRRGLPWEDSWFFNPVLQREVAA